MRGESSVPASRTWLVENRLMHVLCSALPTHAKRHFAGVSEVFVIWLPVHSAQGHGAGVHKACRVNTDAYPHVLKPLGPAKSCETAVTDLTHLESSQGLKPAVHASSLSPVIRIFAIGWADQQLACIK